VRPSTSKRLPDSVTTSISQHRWRGSHRGRRHRSRDTSPCSLPRHRLDDHTEKRRCNLRPYGNRRRPYRTEGHQERRTTVLRSPERRRRLLTINRTGGEEEKKTRTSVATRETGGLTKRGGPGGGRKGGEDSCDRGRSTVVGRPGPNASRTRRPVPPRMQEAAHRLKDRRPATCRTRAEGEIDSRRSPSLRPPAACWRRHRPRRFRAREPISCIDPVFRQAVVGATVVGCAPGEDRNHGNRDSKMWYTFTGFF